jgi:predicted DNA-binding transcriptional regulator AlpA
MRLADVLAMTGATKKTLYRWMEKHPTIAEPDPDSTLGHPFPRPSGNEGRAVLWNREAVEAWWALNGATVGRHPENAEMTTMLWLSFRRAMLVNPEEGLQDDMALVRRYEREGAEVRLWFQNVSEAVYFKLKYG